MTAPWQTDSAAAFIGAALVVIAVAFAVRHAIRTAPYLDHESSADERHRLAQMPLEDRMALTFAEQVEAYLAEEANK